MKLLQLFLFSLTFILVGCVHYKEYPFPYSKSTTVDKRLAGIWNIDINKTDFKKLFNEDKPKNSEDYILVFKPNKNYTMYTLYVGSIDDPSSLVYKAYTSSIEENNYLNFSPEKESDEFMHYKYKIKDKELIIHMQNPKVLMRDIKDKKLWGVVSSNGILPISEIHIIEKAETYKKYLLTQDKELYNLPLYLTR